MQLYLLLLVLRQRMMTDKSLVHEQQKQRQGTSTDIGSEWTRSGICPSFPSRDKPCANDKHFLGIHSKVFIFVKSSDPLPFGCLLLSLGRPDQVNFAPESELTNACFMSFTT